MESEVDQLTRFLLFYQLVDAESGQTSGMLHMQVYPGSYGGTTEFSLLHKKEPFGPITSSFLSQKEPLLSLSVAVEHTWYIVISGGREYTPRTIFCLLEVMYGLQDQEWQFAVRLVEEHNNHPLAGSMPLG